MLPVDKLVRTGWTLFQEQLQPCLHLVASRRNGALLSAPSSSQGEDLGMLAHYEIVTA